MRCPVCRAENNEAPVCRRCKADLTLLFAVEERRAALLSQARQDVALQQWTKVRRLAEDAHALRHDADAAQLAALACLMQGDAGAALTWHTAARVGGPALAGVRQQTG